MGQEGVLVVAQACRDSDSFHFKVPGGPLGVNGMDPSRTPSGTGIAGRGVMWGEKHP